MESMKFSAGVRKRYSFATANHGADIQNINTLVRKYGLKVNRTIDAPTVTTYEIDLNVDTKIKSVLNLEPNFAIAVNDQRVRVYQDGNKLCIEKKGADNQVIIDDLYKGLSSEKLNLMIGIDNRGQKIVCNLEKAPHILVAGTTGSGKSVFLHSCILSLLIAHNKDVDITGIDPKGNEFYDYAHLKNFTFVKDTTTAIQTLKRLVDEMEYRYSELAIARCRDIDEYNVQGNKMRREVCIIDELADLMLTGGKQVEDYIVRLAQKARACGIHLILATQRPSADIITGLIKANIPTRICFTVKSQVDSRIVLDEKGAEKLNGKGDMLFQANGARELLRVQGVNFVKQELINIVTVSYCEQTGTDLEKYRRA